MYVSTSVQQSSGSHGVQLSLPKMQLRVCHEGLGPLRGLEIPERQAARDAPPSLYLNRWNHCVLMQCEQDEYSHDLNRQIILFLLLAGFLRFRSISNRMSGVGLSLPDMSVPNCKSQLRGRQT